MSIEHRQAAFRFKASSLAIAASFGMALGFAGVGLAPAQAANEPNATLSSFSSDEELIEFLKKVRKPPPPPSPAPMADGVANMTAESPAPTQEKAAGDDESITNVQEAGVDEGGIVKNKGDMLVILRRGRLFTVSTKNGDLRPLDSIDAFPPGVNPSSDWYDEMLVTEDRVIVIGYSYGRGGTEVNRFRLDSEGQLTFEDGYHLRSNDYYSSRNYASRLIGNKLIFYSPLYLPYQVVDLVTWTPGLQHWRGEESAKDFKRIVKANQVYVPEKWREQEDVNIEAMHTVTTCDLTAATMECDAMSVLGPGGRTFYVSLHAVYVWVTQWGGSNGEQGPASLVYRLPLDGSEPSAIGARGAPVDQFSFREDWDDGYLNVLVRSEGGGDAMWNPEFASGSVALLRLPLGQFGDGTEEAARRHYRTLPTPTGPGYNFQNRFVGDYLLYGNGNTWWDPSVKAETTLVATTVRDDEVFQLSLPHGVDRIEAMGRDAVVVGADQKNLYFSAVELTSGSQPTLGDRYTLEGASQGETRSHGFFFKPGKSEDADGAAGGVLGLPVARPARPGYTQLFQTSAAIIFLRRANREFAPLGELAAKDENAVDDGCKASCVDWYGNARPIFLRERAFALMGYELVEGELSQTSIRETRRMSFAPPARSGH
jgi:hypothetical protein